MVDQQEKQNTLIKFFGNPIVGIIGSISGVVGIPLSIYLYYASIQAPELTYLVQPTRTLVVRTGATSQLTVRFNGKDLNENVTAAQISFWNAGGKTIRTGPKEAMLQPLVIYTSGGQRILEAKLLKSSREVTKVALNESRFDKGEVEVDWNLLEHNDGGVVQIVYVGDEMVEIEARATVEGQQEVARRVSASEAPLFKSKPSRYSPYISIALMALNTVALTLQAVEVTRRQRRQATLTKIDYVARYGLWLLVLGLITAMVYHLRVVMLGGSPFD